MQSRTILRASSALALLAFGTIATAVTPLGEWQSGIGTK